MYTLRPGEASRAIRKKLKYGNVHRQLRALVVRSIYGVILESQYNSLH